MMRSQTMRMVMVTAMSAVLLATMPPGAEAHHRPNSYCSESGDICQSTRKHDGVRTLSLVMREEYFQSFRLCVIGPAGQRDCKRFPVGDAGGEAYGHDIVWREQFPHRGAGAYVAVWRAYGTRTGKKLGFHVR